MPRMISTNVGGSLPVQSKPLISWHRSMRFSCKVPLGRLGSLWCQVEQELAKAEKGYLKDMQQVGMLKVVSWWCHRYVWVWHGLTRDAAALLLPGQEQTDFDENLVDLVAWNEMREEQRRSNLLTINWYFQAGIVDSFSQYSNLVNIKDFLLNSHEVLGDVLWRSRRSMEMWRAEILDQRLTMPEFILNRWVC